MAHAYFLPFCTVSFAIVARISRLLLLVLRATCVAWDHVAAGRVKLLATHAACRGVLAAEARAMLQQSISESVRRAVGLDEAALRRGAGSFGAKEPAKPEASRVALAAGEAALPAVADSDDSDGDEGGDGGGGAAPSGEGDAFWLAGSADAPPRKRPRPGSAVAAAGEEGGSSGAVPMPAAAESATTRERAGGQAGRGRRGRGSQQKGGQLTDILASLLPQ